MYLAPCILPLALFLAAEASDVVDQKCQNIDCPASETTGSFPEEDFEERHYPKSWWVETESTGRYAFWSLFNYIRGENIKMTAPVLKTRSNGVERMAFYIPEKAFTPSEQPPTPKETGVVTGEKSFTVLVKGYKTKGVEGDYTMDMMNKNDEITKRDVMKAFKDRLNELKIPYDDTIELFAGYDDPWKSERYNEVMVPVRPRTDSTEN